MEHNTYLTKFLETGRVKEAYDFLDFYAKRIYKICKDKNITQKKQFVFNDLDESVYIKENKIVICDQNFNFVFYKDKRGSVKVGQFYKNLPKNKLDKLVNEFNKSKDKKETLIEILKEVSSYADSSYQDYYSTRPSLTEFYKEEESWGSEIYDILEIKARYEPSLFTKLIKVKHKEFKSIISDMEQEYTTINYNKNICNAAANNLVYTYRALCDEYNQEMEIFNLANEDVYSIEYMMKHSLNEYPSTYNDKNRLRFLDQIFFVIGNGRDYTHGKILCCDKWAFINYPAATFEDQPTSAYPWSKEYSLFFKITQNSREDYKQAILHLYNKLNEGVMTVMKGHEKHSRIDDLKEHLIKIKVLPQ